MSRKPKRPSKAGIKAAAARAEARSKGEPIPEPKAPIDPTIIPAKELVVRKKAASKRPRGRPTKYTPALGRAICKMLASGMTLSSISKRPAMPVRSTVLKWALDQSSPFYEQYARARLIGYAAMGDELVDLADDSRNDWMEREERDGRVSVVLNREAMERTKLRIDTRKWLLSKALPKMYGEKVAHEHTGADGGPIQVEDKMALARWIAFELAEATGDAKKEAPAAGGLVH